uniref:Uncharacterized protein n=1 Tax=Pseudomonas phage Cygsa01 TaxID=3138529 RepID=A0AAU6W3Z4_9VIRU
MFTFPPALNGKLSLGAVGAVLIDGLTKKYCTGDVTINSASLDRIGRDIHEAMREIKEAGNMVWDSDREEQVSGFSAVYYRRGNAIEVLPQYSSDPHQLALAS